MDRPGGSLDRRRRAGAFRAQDPTSRSAAFEPSLSNWEAPMRKWALTLLAPIVCAVVCTSCGRGSSGSAGNAGKGSEPVFAGVVEIDGAGRAPQNPEAGTPE